MDPGQLHSPRHETHDGWADEEPSQGDVRLN